MCKVLFAAAGIEARTLLAQLLFGDVRQIIYRCNFMSSLAAIMCHLTHKISTAIRRIQPVNAMAGLRLDIVGYKANKIY